MKQPMIILIGPSGVGKSSFLEQALRDFSRLRDTVTFTTRAMRQGESEGNPYHFVSKERFEQLIEESFFIEHARVHDNWYGTPYSQLEEAWLADEVVIMDVDVQGANTFKTKFPTALTVFILPPSIEALRHRVLKREAGRPPKDLDLRMQNAAKEMSEAGRFDHQIVNDQFAPAYGQLKKLIEDYLRNR
ncbi:MAG: guanylate kinase [Bdellovibrionales bacterium]